MFFISGIVILAFIIAGAWAGLRVEDLGDRAWNYITGMGDAFGWLYTITTTFFLIFVVWLLFSRYGVIKLGPDDSKPEFSTMAWFSMLFTAGMGIGLVFWGVAEPAAYIGGPVAPDAESPDMPDQVMSTTLFHWGFHPWAVYIVLGLALGYFCFRKGLPLRPASAFHPLIGDRIYGWPGHIIDILAVFGTMFGLATSLGLGTRQINAGLTEVTGGAIPFDTWPQMAIIALITAVALVSVLAGIDKGIRRLSVINMWLAVALVVAVFLAGPKLFMISGMADWTGAYLQSIVGNSFAVVNPAVDAEYASWQAGWTFFYWGWWISWAPFVGMFIARISYGRTIRQFIAGVLFAPVGATIVWFGVFGGSGLYYYLTRGTVFGADEDYAEALAMFELLNELPLQGLVVTVLSILTILVVALFFVTSSDSGSLVIDILTNGGDPNPNKGQRAFWCITEGVVAAVLILAGGAAALQALRGASLTTGIPFAVVLVFVAFGLLSALRKENIGELQLKASGLPGPATTERAAEPTAEKVPVGGGSSGSPDEGEKT